MSGRKTEAVIFGESVLFSDGGEGVPVTASDDAKRLLEQLKQSRYLLALVSEKVRSEIDAVLKDSGLDGVFDVIVSREDFGGRQFKELMDFPWKLAFDRFDSVRWGRVVGGRGRSASKPYYKYNLDRALVLAGSASEAEGAVMSGMNVVKVGETDSDGSSRYPNVDLLVDNVVLSLADLVGKMVHRWLTKA